MIGSSIKIFQGGFNNVKPFVIKNKERLYRVFHNAICRRLNPVSRKKTLIELEGNLWNHHVTKVHTIHKYLIL